MAASTLVDINFLDHDPADDEGDQELYDFLEDERLDNKTAGVMQMRVAPSTRTGYLGRNVSFMVWIFDRRSKYSNLIEPSLLSKLLDAHNVDCSIKTKRGKRSKKRDNLRRVCSNSLESIVQSDESTIPVKLEYLSFQIFSRYMGTFKKKVKTKKPTATANSDGTTNEDITIGHGEAEIQLSSSSYDGACSALNHLFIESFTEKDVNDITKDLWCRFSRYKKGMRRKGVQQKGELGLSLAEGKKPLPIAAYKELSKIYLKVRSQSMSPLMRF